jgi:type III pantothenate kinase
MIANADSEPGPPKIIAIDVGNTRTAVALWHEGVVTQVIRVATQDERAFSAAFAEVCGRAGQPRPHGVVVGSVVPEVLPWLARHVQESVGLEPGVIGETIPLPIVLDVPDDAIVGVDRVCSAAAAFAHTGQACIVVDFGTAVTVDVVGDDGQFLGGAILPGARMQARALHEFTSRIPLVDVAFPADPIGKRTEAAVSSGVCHGIAGAVRGLVEAIATHVGKWPQVVGTGGDLPRFMTHCDFLDSAVPDLCLMGIGLAWIRRRERGGSGP